MKKLTSIKNPLFNTLEKSEMKQVFGGVLAKPTATGPGPIITGNKDGTTSSDGTDPGSSNDWADV